MMGILVVLLAASLLLAVLVGISVLLYVLLHRKQDPQGFPIDLHTKRNTQ